MTHQEIFDAGLTHIRQQGKPALRPSPTGEVCSYRTPTGLKCVIGGLIPDELYLPEWDSKGGWSVTNLPATLFRAMGIDESALPLLSDMQSAHDMAPRNNDYNFLAEFEQRMHQLAGEYGLKYEVRNL